MRRPLSLACLLGVAVVVLLCLNRPSGPTYQGRDVEAWLKLREEESVSGGSIITFDVMPEVLAAFQAMGDVAIPELANIALRPPRGEGRRRCLGWVYEKIPWLKYRLPRGIESWARSGESVPEIAVAAMDKLRPPAGLLIPLVSGQLSSPNAQVRFRAMQLLTSVGDHPQDAVQLLLPAVSAGDITSIQLLSTFGSAGYVAVPELVRQLATTNGEAAWIVMHCLGRIGPPASNALPALRRMFDQESGPKLRVRIASNASRIDPSSFWAESEIRLILNETDPNLQEFALGVFEDMPTLARRFESELAALVRSPSTEPRLTRNALQALWRAGLEPGRILPVLTDCLASKEPVVRITAAGHLLDLQPTNARAFACATNALADPYLWHGYRYHPLEAAWLVERLVHLGPLAVPAIPLLRKFGNPEVVNSAVEAIQKAAQPAP